MSMGLRPHRFACERCEQPAHELHFTYINRQPCHVCHDCLRALIAANVARVAARARDDEQAERVAQGQEALAAVRRARERGYEDRDS